MWCQDGKRYAYLRGSNAEAFVALTGIFWAGVPGQVAGDHSGYQTAESAADARSA